VLEPSLRAGNQNSARDALT